MHLQDNLAGKNYVEMQIDVISSGIEKISALMPRNAERATVTRVKGTSIIWGRIKYTEHHQEYMEWMLRAIPAHGVFNVTQRRNPSF